MREAAAADRVSSVYFPGLGRSGGRGLRPGGVHGVRFHHAQALLRPAGRPPLRVGVPPNLPGHVS